MPQHRLRGEMRIHAASANIAFTKRRTCTKRKNLGLVMTPDRIEAARALLEFYSEAGVDALIGETPLDRLSVARIDLAPAITVEQTLDVEQVPERGPVAPAPDLWPSIAPAP